MSRLIHPVRYCTGAIHQNALHNIDIFQRIISNFPSSFQMVFAYGSGVYQQQGQSEKQIKENMLDFIFVVDDPHTWHQQNLKMNRQHYSFLKSFGAKNISLIQEKFGAGIYFNTKVMCEDREIKYGIIGTSRLISDLLDWDTLYVSGRLHKPVKIIVEPERTDLLTAMHINLQSAMHASLLLLPEVFSEEDLYLQIANLSYHGDFRMTVGEDKNKVGNIVKPNILHFRQLYENILEKEEHFMWNKSRGLFEQYPNHASQFHHLNLLPKTVQVNLLSAMCTHPGKYPDMEEVLRSLAFDSFCDKHVSKSIQEIVKKSSLSQSVKGILTAGITKSIKYSSLKLRKMMGWKKKTSS